MRTPSTLSNSSLSIWEKDREEFFLRYLADTRVPKLPQENFMSIGSAFDAYAKSDLHEKLFGKGDPAFAFDAIFTSQVEPHNRDWAKLEGKYVFDCYVYTGAFDELLGMLSKSKETPRFEFEVKGLIGGVPFVGKPDCRFVHECGAHVILDWKVKGYCSKYGASPTKNYRLCRDGYNAILLGQDKTKKCPEGQQSKSHGKTHAGYLAYDHHGFEVNTVNMEVGSVEYADQLAIYGWLLGEEVGDENVAVCIDEIVGKYMGEGNRPLLRIANQRARIGKAHQLGLLDKAVKCWQAITSGHIFADLPREESDERCQQLEEMSVGLRSDGSDVEKWFNEVVRPRFRK